MAAPRAQEINVVLHEKAEIVGDGKGMTTQGLSRAAVTISPSRKNADLKDVQSPCWLRSQKTLDVGFWFPLRYEWKNAPAQR